MRARDIFAKLRRQPSRRNVVVVRNAIEFPVTIAIDDEPDEDGLHQVRIDPLRIATFGSSVEDAIAQAGDALRSYMAAFETTDEMVATLRLYNVDFQRRTEVAGSSTPGIMLNESIDELVRRGPDALPSVPSSRTAHGIARTPCPA